MKNPLVIGSLGVFAFFAFVVFMAGCSGIVSYNSLNHGRNHVDKSWADVQSAYQRRIDSIPNFVATAKFSADFQTKLQTQVAQARSAINSASPQNPGALSDGSNPQSAQSQTAVLLGAIRAEAVPEAKLDQLTELNAQIDNIERVINHQRDVYNTSCEDYRNKVGNFPMLVFASAFGYEKKDCQPFQSDQGASQAPKVDFSK